MAMNDAAAGRRLVLIIGAPGSGKTTTASLAAQQCQDLLNYYSMGELLRQELARGTQLGRQAADFVNQGRLVPLAMVMSIITSAIRASDRNMVLIDGFPRSIEQAKALDDYLTNHSDIELAAVIEVVVSQATARARTLSRARGADDQLEIFNERMKIYLESLAEIEAFYVSKGLLERIDGEQGVSDVVAAMLSIIKRSH